MTNYLDETGLHIESLTDIVDQLEIDFRAIYGQNINVDANSPDGKMIRLFAQAKADMLALIADVYSAISPDRATGAVLDQRCALNGIIRRAATYTETYVYVTIDAPLTLQGLDTTDLPFTVSDANGNEFYLAQTTALSEAGTFPLTFRAAEAGAVLTVQNTITTVVTVTLGVTAVNNPDTALTTGVDEETDVALRLRRRSSVAQASTGYIVGLQGTLANLDGVTDAAVYENTTANTDGNGTPAHSIWCIVDGGDHTAIANAIYQKRSAGCGMRGTNVVNVSDLPVKFDDPIYVPLYMSITLKTLDDDHAIDEAYLKAQIVEQIVYTIYQRADFSAVTALIKSLDPLAVVDSGGVAISGGGPFISFLYPAALQGRFTLDVANISITVV